MSTKQTSKSVANGSRLLEMEIRDVMDGVAELASMISITASSYNCEILSIERPDIAGHPASHNAGNSYRYKEGSRPRKSQVLPFRKR